MCGDICFRTFINARGPFTYTTYMKPVHAIGPLSNWLRLFTIQGQLFILATHCLCLHEVHSFFMPSIFKQLI